MKLAKEEHIVVHGFIQEGENQTWSLCEDDETSGFTVYRRTPIGTGVDGAFDIHDEEDFNQLDLAMAYAETLSKDVLTIFVE